MYASVRVPITNFFLFVSSYSRRLRQGLHSVESIVTIIIRTSARPLAEVLFNVEFIEQTNVSTLGVLGRQGIDSGVYSKGKQKFISWLYSIDSSFHNQLFQRSSRQFLTPKNTKQWCIVSLNSMMKWHCWRLSGAKSGLWQILIIWTMKILKGDGVCVRCIQFCRASRKQNSKSIRSDSKIRNNYPIRWNG